MKHKSNIRKRGSALKFDGRINELKFKFATLLKLVS
jgi:hypothetical protein